MVNIFCWLFGHDNIKLGPRENLCLKCDKVSIDVKLEGIDKDKAKIYLESIEEEADRIRKELNKQ